jgi:hypothetical protein
MYVLRAPTLPLSQPSIPPHPQIGAVPTDGAELAPEAADGLRQRAEYILTFAEGEHSPSKARLGPHVITHELLLAAHDAVKLAAHDSKLTGKAQKRLLAWVLADAMSSGRPLDKQLAETVGKRLEKQCNKVASELAAAAIEAEQARDRAQRAATLAELNGGLSTALAGEPPETLASIDALAAETRRLINLEVYVGFHELGLSSSWARHELMGPPPPKFQQPLSPSTLSHVEDQINQEDDALFDSFERWKERGPAAVIPQLLARTLGDDGCATVSRWINGGTLHGNDVLNMSIPFALKHQLEMNARMSQLHADELAALSSSHESECEMLRDRCDDAMNEVDRTFKECEQWRRMCEQLRLQAAESRGREQALRQLLESIMPK